MNFYTGYGMHFALAAFALFSFLGPGPDNITFDKTRPGEMPPNWSAAQTHSGPPPQWFVRKDPGAPSRPNVFSQDSTDTGRFEFDLALYDKVVCRDGDLSVKFRIRPGRGSRTAGLVWRYQDSNNYYLLHFSVDEHNVVLFRVQNGKAEPIPVIGGKGNSIGVRHDVRAGVWYVARVVFRGSRVRVVLGNRLLFDATDNAIASAGKTGLWTRGSTIASFDDFRIEKKN